MSTGGLTRGSSFEEVKHGCDKGSNITMLRRLKDLKCWNQLAAIGKTDVKKSLCIEHVGRS